MSYSKIEYYENGCLKSVTIKGFFVSFSGNIQDLKQDKDKKRDINE